MTSTSPAEHAAAITTSNTVNLTNATRGIYVGGTGDLKVDMIGGETVTLVGVAAGVVHPIAALRVYATGTTATLLVALW